MNHQIFERKLRSVGVPLEHASFSVVSTYLSDVLITVRLLESGHHPVFICWVWLQDDRVL